MVNKFIYRLNVNVMKIIQIEVLPDGLIQLHWPTDGPAGGEAIVTDSSDFISLVVEGFVKTSIDVRTLCVVADKVLRCKKEAGL